MKETKDLSACIPLAGQYPYYRADVFSACLLEAGFAPEQIAIARKSESEQGFLYDIEKVSVKYPYLYPESPYLSIESGRPGIYDALPEDLFFAADHSGHERDKKHIIERIRANKQAERAVRRFLSLFETEADSFLCDLRTEELRYDKRHLYPEFAAVFKQHWSVIGLMYPCEALRFLQVVPHLYALRGDTGVAGNALSFILNIRTSFRKIYRPEKPDNSFAPALREIRLDDNSVLVSDESQEVTPVMRVTLSELDRETCREFFKGKPREKMLRHLAGLFFEPTLPLRIELVPEKEAQQFWLGADTRDSYLDINTYL